MLWLPTNVGSSRRGVHREAYVPTTEEILIEDFESWSVVHDEPWLDTQSLNTEAMIVKPKYDNISGHVATGPPVFSMDATGGYGGSRALKITMESGANRLPGWWFIRWRKSGSGTFAIPSGTGSYFIQPHTEDITAIRFRLKFDTDYRAAFGASAVSAETYGFTVGTYQNTEENAASDDEQFNWHHYHNFFLRHDVVNNDWFDVEINCLPFHQRNGSFGINGGVQIYEPVKYQPDGTPLGSYWSHCTRIYFDSLEYFDLPEIATPCSVWIDSIYAIKRPAENYLTITPTDYTDGEQFDVTVASTTVTVHFDVTNNTGASYTAYVMIGGWYRLTQVLTEDGVGTKSNGTTITWSSGETKSFTFACSPDSLSFNNVNDVRPAGVTFVPQSQTEDGGTSYRNRSNIDTDVENRRNLYEGKTDAVGIVSTRIHLKKVA